MGNQSASRRQGDRFQDLYCWREILRLLRDGSPYEYAWIEHPQAGSADDLTLHPRSGAATSTQYVQIKWHVDHRDAISFESLAEAGDKSRSLIRSLFESWRVLKRDGPVEVWLVTNWSAAPALGGFLDGSTYCFKEDLFSGRPQARTALEVWTKALEAEPEELKEFCRSLRLRVGYHSLRDLEEVVDDAMQVCRLRSGPNARAIARDLLSSLIEKGGEEKKLDRSKLRFLVSQRDLWEQARPTQEGVRSGEPSPVEPNVRMWVHGWAKRAWAEPPEVELDWTQYFVRAERRIPDQETWERVLFPQLTEKRRFLEETGRMFIDFRAKIPLTAALAIGSAFPEVDGFSFRTEQPVGGEIFLWASNTQATGRSFRVAEDEGEPEGKDVLVIFSVTGDSSGAITGLRERLRPTLAAVFHAMPDGGPGGTSIHSAGDATALAQEAKEVLRKAHNRFPGCRKHLVVYSPAAFSLFLGMKLNALGEILTYEMNAAGDDYQSSVLLRTN